MNLEENCLSIITNFGCHYKCPYCIVKENNLKIPKTTVEGLKKLKENIIKNNINILSVSGGGDPIHNFHDHKDWYRALFNIMSTLTIPMEIHTSYIGNKDFPYSRFNRVVYHVNLNTDLSKIKRTGTERVRIVFVVTEEFTPSIIDKIVKQVEANVDIDDLTFRQMMDDTYSMTYYCYDYLLNGHKNKWWYIQQSDYNLYYFENRTSTKFEDFKKD